MDRNTMFNTESIYDNYLSAEGPRASTLSGVSGAERLSGLAPPIPRNQAGRQTAYSMADTASVYTTATTPFERWSLEDGLEPPEPKSPTSVYGAGGTQRPPDSPRLADLRNMGGPARTAPIHAQVPVATSMSPQPVQYSRRHFSRPFRPEEAEEQPNMHAMITPKIMVGQHRFSASTPDAYGGASFSPAIPGDSPQLSAYASDIAGDDHSMGHIRRRSNPANGAHDDARSASPTSVYGDERGRGLQHAQRSSLSGTSIQEKPEEDDFNEKRDPHPRPFSFSNTYPFTTGQNGFSNQNVDTVRTLAHKPSSRFSEDEKGVRSMDSTNEFHSSTWNLFGRSPTASPMWRHSEDGRRNLAPVPVEATKKKKKRRILIWVVAILILLALAGIGAGIGIWRHNVSVDNAHNSVSAKDGDSPATPSTTGADGSTSSGTSPVGDNSADVTLPARDTAAVAGSGGPGGYYSLVAFGGSYADNGHSRVDEYSNTLSVAPYDGGRATNGLVFQEYMASLVGPTESQAATVFNYAYSGSSLNNTISTAQAPDLPAQIASYLGELNNGNATVAATINNKALITVWAGMDELVSIWQSAISAAPGDPQTPALAEVRSMVSTLNSTLRWLLPATGTPLPDFVLITLPRGDILPQTARLAMNNTGYINVFKNMTAAYNVGLGQVAESLSATTSVYALEADSLFDSIYTTPSSYNLTSVNTACRDQDCTDPDSYMWYDGMNPSTRMHSLVARHLAAKILEPTT